MMYGERRLSDEAYAKALRADIERLKKRRDAFRRSGFNNCAQSKQREINELQRRLDSLEEKDDV